MVGIKASKVVLGFKEMIMNTEKGKILVNWGAKKFMNI